MALIIFEDKETLIDNPDIDEKNKVTANNINEIKRVVNENSIILSHNSLPVGSIIDFDGTNIPVGYEEVKKDSKLVWINPNPTAYFGPQTISLDSDIDWDIGEIFYYDFISNKRMQSTRFIKGNKVMLNSIFDYNNKVYAGYRSGEFVTDNSIKFGGAWSIIAESVLSVENVNDWLIPVYVIVYKTGTILENEIMKIKKTDNFISVGDQS